jgi:hypothetical protein
LSAAAGTPEQPGPHLIERPDDPERALPYAKGVGSARNAGFVTWSNGSGGTIAFAGAAANGTATLLDGGRKLRVSWKSKVGTQELEGETDLLRKR